jgi:hypothetical protein
MVTAQSVKIVHHLWNNSGPCVFGESIKDEILIPAGWSHHRIYRDTIIDGCQTDSPPETAITDETCGTAFSEIWGAGRFGLVIWYAHGNSGGSLISNRQTSLLNDNYPSFTFQVSCLTGSPEDPNNLAYSLLRRGAVCTVAPTRWAWAAPYQFSATGMAYEYTSRIVAGLTNGEALYALKERIQPHSGLYWRNFLNFNIYGDPSLRLAPLQSRILYVDINADTLVAYSNVQAGQPSPWLGMGNIDIDPEFVDPNSGDYHLKSQAGRWNPTDETWEIDDVISPCIDTGDPLSPVGAEPEPNGGRINMGAYGGAAEAGKSP